MQLVGTFMTSLSHCSTKHVSCKLFLVTMINNGWWNMRVCVCVCVVCKIFNTGSNRLHLYSGDWGQECSAILTYINTQRLLFIGQSASSPSSMVVKHGPSMLDIWKCWNLSTLDACSAFKVTWQDRVPHIEILKLLEY